MTATLNGTNSTLPATALSPTEAEQLHQYEDTIRQGLHVFYEVGIALTAIRDRKLYRATHKSFEAYVIAKWEFGRTQAYRLIDAAAIINSLKETGVQPEALPTSDRQTRALAPLPPEKQAEVWREARKVSPDPTGKQVQDLASRARGVPARKPQPITPHHPMPSPEVRERGAQLERNVNCIVLQKRLKETLLGYGEKAKTALEIMDLLEQAIATLTADLP
jgi:hypothetical protein